MSLANGVWTELRKIREHKAFYAAAGAGDAAAQALRELPERLAWLQGKADLAAWSGRVVEYVMVAGARVVQAYDELAERGMQVTGGAGPRRVGELPQASSGEVARGADQDGDGSGQGQDG